MPLIVDYLDIIKPVLGLLVGFLGRWFNYWSRLSLKGLGDVVFRFVGPMVFMQSILESTSTTMHWAMPLGIFLFNIITLVGAWFLFAHVPWPNNVILTMGSTGLMGGAIISWALSYFGLIGMETFIYQETYDVVHIYLTVFVFAFYFLKVKAPKKLENTITLDVAGTGGTKGPDTWKGLGKQILHFPGAIAFLTAWPIYFVLLACNVEVGESMREIFTYFTSGVDFYIMLFVGGSLSVADIKKQSQNLDMWKAYFFRYIVAFPIFFMFYYDVFPNVDILTKDLMLMYIWLPVPAPFVFYVLLFVPNEDPSIITSLAALTQITQLIIFIVLGFVYFQDLGTTG